MKKILDMILISCIVGILMGCSSMMFVGAKHTTYGSMVEVIEYDAAAKVEYLSHRYLLSDLKDKARVQMWPSDTIEKKISHLPAGGYISVKVMGPTLASADTKYWEYVVTSMDGQEITRRQGESDTPKYTASEYGTTWWNYDIVLIHQKLTGPFKVFVLDRLRNRRSGFIVYPGHADR